MKLREYLRPELIVLDLEARDSAEVIRTLVRRMTELEAVADPAAVTQALLAREAVHTTAMGNGVAVPHATVAGLDHPILLVAVSRDGVMYGPSGVEPVRLIFMLLSPPDRAGLHIKLPARIARLARAAVDAAAMGDGVAGPHATVAGLDHPVLLVAVWRDGVMYGASGVEPVRLIFMLLSPPDRAGLHIKLLARIARLARHPGLVT